MGVSFFFFFFFGRSVGGGGPPPGGGGGGVQTGEVRTPLRNRPMTQETLISNQKKSIKGFLKPKKPSEVKYF